MERLGTMTSCGKMLKSEKCFHLVRVSPLRPPSCRMMGIARSSVVCFVIDTTGSMSDDIAEARKVVYDIIDSKKGTQDEPSEYILVPFNDPGMTFILLGQLHAALLPCLCLKVLFHITSEEGKVICWFDTVSFYAFYADFGPLIRTTDPDKMKKEISALRPTGGGDAPEMCLSGLQVQHKHHTSCLQP